MALFEQSIFPKYWKEIGSGILICHTRQNDVTSHKHNEQHFFEMLPYNNICIDENAVKSC